MKIDDSILSRIEIAKPCTASWENMTGDERERACQQCHLIVYNISSMTKTEAESFLSERLPKGRVCLRLFRRQDGTIITDNCPKGLRAARDLALRAKQKCAVAAAALFAFCGGTAHSQKLGDAPVRLQGEAMVTPSNAKMGDVYVKPLPALMGSPAPILPANGPEMTAYLAKAREKIKYKLSANSGKTIKVVFKIVGDGTVSDLKIAQSSGDKDLDDKALADIRKSAPFEKLPALSPLPFNADITFK